MNKLKNYFRIKLRRFLGVDDLDYSLGKLTHSVEYNQKSNISYHDTLRDRISTNATNINAIHTTLESVVDVATDVCVHPNQNHSWAVVCIEGKVNRIKFIDLNHAYAQDVFNFLKQFEASRHIVDSPFSFRHHFQENFVFNIDNR